MNEENKELAVKQELRPQIGMSVPGVLKFQTFDELARACVAYSRSGLAPKGLTTPEALMVAAVAGMECGLSFHQAIQSIAVINGRASLYGDGALAVVSAHPEFEDIEESVEGTGDKMVASCVIRRKGRLPIKRSFSVTEAKHAKLWGKAGSWTDYPSRMLSMRARSWAMRDSFADALKGVGIKEEVEDIPAREMKRVNAIVLPGDPEPQGAPVEEFQLTAEEKDEIEAQEKME